MWSQVVWCQVERIESRMYPHTWWQCEFEGVVTHLTGDLVRTSTLESKNTGCIKLGTLLRGHLDQGPITYVKRMALAMLVSLRDRLAWRSLKMALAAIHSLRMRSINCRTFSERVFTGESRL